MKEPDIRNVGDLWELTVATRYFERIFQYFRASNTRKGDRRLCASLIWTARLGERKSQSRILCHLTFVSFHHVRALVAVASMQRMWSTYLDSDPGHGEGGTAAFGGRVVCASRK